MYTSGQDRCLTRSGGHSHQARQRPDARRGLETLISHLFLTTALSYRLKKLRTLDFLDYERRAPAMPR